MFTSAEKRMSAFLLYVIACMGSVVRAQMTWNVVFVAGQSNSVVTNSQQAGQYPTWAITPNITSYCWKGGCNGTFAPAQVPIPNEANVGFSQTYANLLLSTLPVDNGVVIVNTGVGGTGFHLKEWCPTCPLAIQSVNVLKQLYTALPLKLGGTYKLHSMLWHQGEQDAGDNGDKYQADYCTYLMTDLSALIDFFRANIPGASSSTPFIDGGLLPYWEDILPGTEGVQMAIYALNTSRACTATADSRIFADTLPNGLCVHLCLVPL